MEKEIINHCGELLEVVDNYAEITFLELFGNYVVEYGGKTYRNIEKDSYTMFYGKTKKFETLQECYDFCKEIGATIIKEFCIHHSLAHGLPDCRAISPTLHRNL